MNKKDLKPGSPYWIPNVNRADLPEFFKSLGFKKGVEIGVSWAQNIIGYCEAGFEIYGVDPWDAHTDEDEFRKLVSIDGKYGSTVDGVYRLAKERTEKYPNCKLMKMTSIEALDYFPDRSLDFVYIDANHSFGYVAMDLMKWNRKVKKGGIIAGHDYFSHNPRTQRQLRGIGNIVEAFAKTYDFKDWYVLGSKERKEGEDSELSFMFIKHW
ncbi:MAG: class I SAM-dependent methyltransferase [Sphingomonas sp.]|jgi:hypothetical protein